MRKMTMNELESFMMMPEDKQWEWLLGIPELRWWQKIQVKFLHKWWTYMYKSNPHFRAKVLWESIRKGRF